MQSELWLAIKAYLANDCETHHEAMLAFLGRSAATMEAAEEGGKYKALSYVIDNALPFFVEYLKSGQIPGTIKGEGPADEDEE